jgi:hypothetical protein
MRRAAHQLAIPLTVAGGVVFAIAVATNSNRVYGAALLIFAAGLACFLVFPLSPHARSATLAYGGLVVAIVASVVDATVDFADAVGTISSVTTVLILVGALAAFGGRTTGPAGRPAR